MEYVKTCFDNLYICIIYQDRFQTHILHLTSMTFHDLDTSYLHKIHDLNLQ